EEAPERGVLTVSDKAHGVVGERVQVGSGRQRVASRAGPHLDVEAERALDLGDQVRKGLSDEFAQLPQFLREATYALAGDLRIVLGGPGVVDGVDEAAALRGQVQDRTAQNIVLPPEFRTGCGEVTSGPPGQFGGAGPQRGQVMWADAPAGPGEQTGEFVARGGVVHHP